MPTFYAKYLHKYVTLYIVLRTTGMEKTTEWISFEEWQVLRKWYVKAEAPFRYMNEDIKFW